MLLSSFQQDTSAPNEKLPSLKSTLGRVGDLACINGIKTLLIHIMTFIGVVVDNVEKTVLYQMTNEVLTLILKRDFVDWHDVNGADFIYSALRVVEQILICNRKFSTDLNNVNALMTLLPGGTPSFDDKHLVNGLRILKTFIDNVETAIANDVPLQTQSAVAQSYKLMSKAGNGASTPAGTPCNLNNGPTGNDAKKQGAGAAKKNTNPPSGDASPAKKPRRANANVVRVDTAPRKQAEELGLFILNDPTILANLIFPLSVAVRDGKALCANFVCKGKACTQSGLTCTRAHVTRVTEISQENTEKIAKHFIEKSIGKFNSAAFRGVELPEDLKSVMSG